MNIFTTSIQKHYTQLILHRIFFLPLLLIILLQISLFPSIALANNNNDNYLFKSSTSVPALSAQVTLFADGSIRLEYDNSIPALIPSGNGNSNSIVVGLSNGRLHVNGDGKYVSNKRANIVSFTDVMNGDSTKNADTIY